MVDEPDDDGSYDVTLRADPTVRGIAGESADAGPAPVASLPAPPTSPHGPRAKRRTTQPPPIVPIGTRYTYGPKLGEGGMGEVVLAFDEHIGREVAVKRILREAPSADDRSRFFREARVQGRLEHPAVVPVHELGVDEAGRPYFVMKRLTGKSMGDVLKSIRAGHTTDVASERRQLLRALVDVCHAIELAHSRGVVHRDLKPANIMLGDFGEVYVLDWGVAHVHEAGPAQTVLGVPSAGSAVVPHGLGDHGTADLVSDDTRTGSILGTPGYMAPEQLAGEPATPAADLYALGCVLFEIIAGEPLHQKTRSAVKAIDGRPSTRRPDAPPELDVVCQRATELDPAARHASARALGDAVQAFLDGDRDVAVRRELAEHHLIQAREAIGRADTSFSLGLTDAKRSLAMREAGRALALDPESGEAALLVTQLMMQPPTHTPPEVEARLAALDVEAAAFQGRLAALAMIGYLGFLPFLLWTGVRDAWLVVAFAAVAVIGGVQVFLLARRTEINALGIYANAAINATLIALVSRIVGPFLVAPTLVMTTLVAYAVHPRLGRIHIIAIVLASGLAIPWLLEVLGVLASTYRFDHGELVLASPAIAFTSLPVQLAFVALLVALIAIVALLSRTLAMRNRDVTRRIELQAWQLRQLVPARS